MIADILEGFNDVIGLEHSGLIVVSDQESRAIGYRYAAFASFKFAITFLKADKAFIEPILLDGVRFADASVTGYVLLPAGAKGIRQRRGCSFFQQRIPPSIR